MLPAKHGLRELDIAAAESRAMKLSAQLSGKKEILLSNNINLWKHTVGYSYMCHAFFIFITVFWCDSNYLIAVSM